ncbi:MAG: glycosyltransferase family 2 protein [Lachnospiraceae bacterium]|nr:glycosyltransferase family 2 protein [Lachnospiraceae bacterium]
MAKLSVIIPVYNMAKDGNLNFCLDSIINQDYKDLEIIAVNDASTDNSLEILREYERRYPEKVKVVTYKDNRHQGGARNEGIKYATGEWIGFIDSDDWVAADYFSKLITKGEETGADVVGCTFNLVNCHTFEVGKIVETNTVDQSGELDTEKRKRFLEKTGSSVTKIYRTSLIRDNNLSFPEHIFYEDNAAGPVWAMYFKHFEYIDEPLYYYYQHDSSTVHTITAERCNDRMTAGEMMLSEIKKRGFLKEYHDEIESIFTTIYFTNTVFSYMRIKKGKKYSVIKHIKKRMMEEFPDFRSNKNYGKFMDDEQKRYVNLMMKNSLAFYIKYSLLWMYRDLRAGK